MKKLSWETRKKIYVAVGVLLILAMGFLLVNYALRSVLDWAFKPSLPKGFDDQIVEQVFERAQLTVPGNARYLYGEYYGWQDSWLTVVLSIPYSYHEFQVSEYLQAALLGDAQGWEETNLMITHNESLLAYMPDVLGSFCVKKGNCILRVDYSSPVNGNVYILLHCLIG